jgi:hypothetical protein
MCRDVERSGYESAQPRRDPAAQIAECHRTPPKPDRPQGRDAHSSLVDQALRGRYDSGMDYSHIITVEPGKRSGQTGVRGMRITVRETAR